MMGNESFVRLSKLFREELLKLVGEECWGVVGGVGTGSIIRLSIGKKFLRDRPVENSHIGNEERMYSASLGFMISCPWRIENEFEVFCGSHHTNESHGPYKDGFNQIRGQKIIQIICENPSFDLSLKFENAVVLKIHCSSIGVDADECYSFRSSRGWFEIGFDGRIALINGS